MPVGSTFKRSTPAAPVAQAPKRSRYQGARVVEPQTKMPAPGLYRMRVLSCTEGFNPKTGNESFKAELEIVAIVEGGEGHRVGETVTIVNIISGKGGQYGIGRSKALVMAAAGYDSEAEYDAFDPDGDFIAACVGVANEYSARGENIVGRLVDAQITRGKDIMNPTTNAPTGDYYRDCSWAPVPDDEQTTT